MQPANQAPGKPLDAQHIDSGPSRPDWLLAGPTIVIQPRHPWSLGIRSLLAHRELTYFLARRDVKLRYKQTFFGVGWALIQPILLMGVFGLFFGRLAGSRRTDFPTRSSCSLASCRGRSARTGLMPSSRSVVASNQTWSRRSTSHGYPIPVAAAASFRIDLSSLSPFWSWSSLSGVFIRRGGSPCSRSWPCSRCSSAARFGIFFAALNVRYRDVAYMMPFLVQLLCSPRRSATRALLSRRISALSTASIRSPASSRRSVGSAATSHIPCAQFSVSIAVTPAAGLRWPRVFRANRGLVRRHHLMATSSPHRGWGSATGSARTRPATGD